MKEWVYREGAGLAQKIEQERELEEAQQKLKQQHHIKDENILVVERKSLLRFLIQVGIAALKTSAILVTLILATFGLLAMLYPEPRSALLDVLHIIIEDGKTMMGI